MIVLDTNVISEVAKPRPDPRVIAWLAEEPRLKLTTTVVLGELVAWIEQQPTVQRQRELAAALHEYTDALIEQDLVLPYDVSAAISFGRIFADRRSIGRPIATSDAMIAVICLSRSLPLATRNVKDFEFIGVELINPWEGP